MRNKLPVLLAIIAMFAATVAGTASPGSASAVHAQKAGPKIFKTTVTPSTGATLGTTLVAKSTGAIKKTDYFCITSVISRKDGVTLTASDTTNFKVVRSNRKGAMTCKLPYRPFSAEDENGKVRHCPTTRADKRAGFKCAVAIADKATIGAKAASLGYFKPA